MDKIRIMWNDAMPKLVPMQGTPIIVSTAGWQPSKTIMSRYANKMVNSKYYMTISECRDLMAKKVSKTVERIFNDLDPYGEEDWNN
jgi:hypothetical protein